MCLSRVLQLSRQEVESNSPPLESEPGSQLAQKEQNAAEVDTK